MKSIGGLRRLLHWMLALVVLLQGVGFVNSSDPTSLGAACRISSESVPDRIVRTKQSEGQTHCHHQSHSRGGSHSTGTQLPHPCETCGAGALMALLRIEGHHFSPPCLGPWPFLTRADGAEDFLPAVPLRPPNDITG